MKNVILSIDSLYPPFTGIGKYTAFIAEGLCKTSEFESIKFFDNGRWTNQQEVIRRIVPTTTHPLETKSLSLIPRLRRKATQSRLVMSMYSRISPYLFARRLAPYSKTHLYHSPNFLAPEFAGKKVTTFHDLSILKYPEFHPEARVRFLTKAMARSIATSDLIIVDSETIKNEIIEQYGIAEDRLSCVPLAATLAQVERLTLGNTFLQAKGLRAKKYFLSASTIEPRKNVETTIRAYQALPSHIKEEYALAIAGDIGWKSEHIHESLRDANQKNIHYLGYVTDAQLAELFEHAAAFVSSSLYEGFGLPCLEAQYFGIPALISDIPVHVEVTGGLAVYFPPNDSEALSSLFTDVAARPESFAANVEQGKRHAQGFSWDATVRQILDIYHSF